MPFYKYKCLECSTEYDKAHGMKLEPEFKCEAKTCDGVLSRVPTMCSFSIKGDSSANNWGSQPDKIPGADFSAELST